MSSLASHRLLHSYVTVSWIGVFLAALMGCATTPRPPAAVGVSVVSLPPEALLAAAGSTDTSATESSGSVGIPKGWGSFGPGALLLVPFALAYDALRGPAKSELNQCASASMGPTDMAFPPGFSRYRCSTSQCDAKLSSTYPGATTMFRDAVEREFVPNDVLEAFMELLRKYSGGGEVVAVASPTEPREVVWAICKR
jgi:hypothetical protein